jgi:ABC-type phosphate transport system substrate-binding protein
MRKYPLALALLLLSLGMHAHSAFAQVVVVVSARSTIPSLTQQQIADIFMGKVSRLPDGPAVIPIDQAEDSAIREKFYLQATGKSPAQMKAYWSKIIFTGRGQPHRQVASVGEIKKLVAADTSMIAYVDAGAVDASLRIVFSP